MSRPAAIDPHFYTEEGAKDFLKGGQRSNYFNVDSLVQFRMGGPWDAQRANGRFYPEFRDFANVAIGLYAGGAGLTADQINFVADQYAARAGSRYMDALDPVFTHLAERNVISVELGVSLQRNGEVCTPTP